MAGGFQSSAFQSDAFQEDTGTTATTTDAPTTADVVTRALVASRAVTAAPTTSDVATRAQVLFRAATEAISTADVAARALVLARATTDAPTAADAVTRTAVLSRTDSESIATSDAAVIASVARTTSDAPTTSDTATRTLTASRAASDAPTTADAATRAGTLSRTVSDAPTTADAATHSNGAARTTTDAPTTSDTTIRVVALGRATTDGPTIAGAVTRSAVLSRTTTDSPTTSDTPFATSTNVSRTATQSISTAEAATWARNVVRSTTEAVSATVAATRAVVLSRSLTQSLTGADVAMNVPVPYLPGPVIYIDGVNITKADGDPVVFSTARFMSAVNGVAGEAHFRVRDDLGTSTYIPGQPLSLVIDGQATWTGFITNVKRVYAFPALNVDDFGPTRFFDIDGTDLNILFSRRIVFNTAHPENVLAPLYSFYTPDVTAISDLLAGWLDLSGDALDTSTDVHHVGAINADQLARAWEGSDTWGQAMQSITALPASIYYIRPNRLFAYVDTDTPDAPFGLSDVPNGTTSKGYREMEVLFDGTNLANDVLAWGVGYGSTSPVFTRAEDATSQSEHGLWQTGQTAFGIYKQATIDRVADSILNGSPDHHRGAKDDRHAVTITTYEPGLLPAQKLLFESNVFGYSEVLPIRKMEITFPTPTTPRYELTLSQEIDVPWSFFDVFRLPGFGFKLPGFTLPPFPPVIIPGGTCPPGNATYTETVDWSNVAVKWGYTGGATVSGPFSPNDSVSPIPPGPTHRSGTTPPEPDQIVFTSCWVNEAVTTRYNRVFHISGLRVFSRTGFPREAIDSTPRAFHLYTVSTYSPDVAPEAAYHQTGEASLSFATISGAPAYVIPDFDIVANGLDHLNLYIVMDTPYGLDDEIIVTSPLPTVTVDFSFVGGAQVMTDNFERVVVGGLGGASYNPFLVIWDTSGSFPGSSVWSVDGSRAIATVGAGFEFAEGDLYPISGYAEDATITSQLLTGTDADDEISFSLTPSGPITGASRFIAVGFHRNGFLELVGDVSHAYYDSTTLAFGPETEFKVRIARLGTLGQAKVWLATDEEPAAWTLTIAVPTMAAVPFERYTISSDSPTTGDAISASFDDLAILGSGPDVDGPCVPSGSGQLFGPWNENATRIDSTHYQLSRSIVPGTAYVWLDGFIARSGTDFTEDDAAGQIVFTSAVGSTVTVTVNYQAAGMPA